VRGTARRVHILVEHATAVVDDRATDAGNQPGHQRADDERAGDERARDERARNRWTRDE
jgi:hypothetical protein